MGTYTLYPVDGIPSFTGGAVGYIAYDCVRHFEPKVRPGWVGLGPDRHRLLEFTSLYLS